MLPTKKELINLATTAYKERHARIKAEQEAARQLEYQRLCNIANELYCKLPGLMLEEAKQERFAVIINCGNGASGETVAHLLKDYVKAENNNDFKIDVYLKRETVSNIGFGVGCDEPDTKEISYWAFRIYW